MGRAVDELNAGNNVNLGSGYFGNSDVAENMDIFRAIVDSNELLSYTFRHNDTDYTHYVDVAQLSGFEMTGLDDRFERTLTLLEP